MSDDAVEVGTRLTQEEITVVREYDVTNAPPLHHWSRGAFLPARAQLTYTWWDYGMSGFEWRLTSAKAQGWTGEYSGVTEINFPTVGRRPDWLNDLVNQASTEMAERKVVKT